MRHLFSSALFVVGLCLIVSPASGQTKGFHGTSLGESQNSPADLVNSLVPGPQKYGKGEKKEEVDTKKLTSKKSNDTLFAGGLNDVAVDWRGSGMGKPHTASETSSKPAKTEAAGEKDLKTAKVSDAAAAAQTKEQTSATTSKTQEKASAEKDKSSDNANPR